jgi:hypothetical protein
MPIECNLPFAIQISTILGSTLGVIFAIIFMVNSNLGGVIFFIFVILFCVLVILSEVYVITPMRYTAFILTIWGKGMMFLFLGFFEFSTTGVGLAAGIIFWLLFIVYVAVFFVIGSTAPPLFQKETPPQFETTEADYYGTGEAVEAQPNTNLGLQEDVQAPEVAKAPPEVAAARESDPGPAPTRKVSGAVERRPTEAENPFG